MDENKAIAFKLRYDEISKEAALREKEGLRPRPDPAPLPQQGPPCTSGGFSQG